MIAASMVAGILSETFSLAASRATLGFSIPNECAASTAQVTILTFVARSGAGMTATSETSSSLPCVAW